MTREAPDGRALSRLRPHASLICAYSPPHASCNCLMDQQPHAAVWPRQSWFYRRQTEDIFSHHDQTDSAPAPLQRHLFATWSCRPCLL